MTKERLIAWLESWRLDVKDNPEPRDPDLAHNRMLDRAIQYVELTVDDFALPEHQQNLIDATIRWRQGDRYNDAEVCEAVDALLGFQPAVEIINDIKMVEALKENARKCGATEEEIAKVLP